ncbi:hydrogen gas-evolving membrane-bound hydrogenase subunit E [Levilinea saccharolytica]|uniref:Multisubunit potassium/proton antiporter, PhaA subunit n=1 Tax=Levilinea saccharolytica TaxID=229921 RepID=A0A0N0RDF3_9CHLR|nr:hydrogen gas-evolving membrane-bound hydrogenase subunit E [Levilinea saccharolytica]GAP19423.1 multisubunit potassium/proton antiporter, PhaA subunit [Levilinea saccharolytica]
MNFLAWVFFAPLFCLLAALGVSLWARSARSSVRLGLLVSLAPLAAFLSVAAVLPRVTAGNPLRLNLPWMPSLGLEAAFFLDGLGALFALLISGIGVLVVLYAGYYFADHPEDAPRFFSLLMLFTAAMLGLVLAGDVITLFIFWEGTSVVSFLLVGFKHKDEAARRGALRAFWITGGGGLALLFGLLLLAEMAGSTRLSVILASGPVLRAHAHYPLALVLIALGAFTKSAQFPFHFWLPGAMSAPTPASAFLHSATMVKAGLYLVARLNPALGGTDLWFWLFSLTGMVTLLVGAWLGLRQRDLKALLAYSTISQLGVLMMLLGQDTSIAFKGFVIGVTAHALYKSALFLTAGAVDLAAGTRDLTKLGGLWKTHRGLGLAAGVAGLSMAGLPPLFGFLAKETLLAAVTHPNIPPVTSLVFTASTVIAGALMLAQAGRFVVDTFFGERPAAQPPARPLARAVAVLCAVPAGLSLLLTSLPEPEPIAAFLASAASAAYGGPVKVSLALWTGINPPLVLSVIAVSLGLFLFYRRARVIADQEFFSAWAGRPNLETPARAALRLLDRAAAVSLRTQSGKLRRYLAVILAASSLLVAYALLRQPIAFQSLAVPTPDLAGGLGVLRLFALLLVVGASAASVFLQRDLMAVLALGASGLSVAVLFALEPAPDVALVQIVVDLLVTTILILALRRIPRPLREQANDRRTASGSVRDALLAAAGGLWMAAVTLISLTSRPRVSIVTPFYEANAKPLTGARDVVGAIVLDFRGFDTLIEITVFAVASLGVYTLLRRGLGLYRAAHEMPADEKPHRSFLMGIGGQRPSALVRLLTDAILPLSMVIAVVHMMYGHDQPGDGFTAGVMVALATGLWHIVYGNREARRRLPWLHPTPLVAAGLLTVLVSASLGAWISGSFLSAVDFGKLWGLSLPPGFALSTAFFFEVGIFLVVLGSAARMLDTLAFGEEAAPRQGG